jgi:hypothetical protein
VLEVPEGWELLPPGDAGLTRRVKAGGPSWTVQIKRGRKLFSQGVWAPAERIAEARGAVASVRGTDAYQRRRKADARRRTERQEAYVEEFEREVLDFLAFHPRHAALARTLACRVAEHSTPIGSGTVARTERIPIAERAESAVIAWLRHQTTAYERMNITRIKGQRREVRRVLARESRRLLQSYRSGQEPEPNCPLRHALGAALVEESRNNGPEVDGWTE